MLLRNGLVERAVGDAGVVRPVYQGEGDTAVALFSHATRAVGCALALQPELQAARWPAGFGLRVRVALHSGEALSRDAGKQWPCRAAARKTKEGARNEDT
jgi:class 3 adenylate cyclase